MTSTLIDTAIDTASDLTGLVAHTLAETLYAVGRFLDPDARRLRAVEADPRIATADDVEHLVRAQGVSEARVWAVVDRLASADLDPTQCWNWTMRYDASELADLFGSDMSDDEIRIVLAFRAPLTAVRAA